MQLNIGLSKLKSHVFFTKSKNYFKFYIIYKKSRAFKFTSNGKHNCSVNKIPGQYKESWL